MEAIAKGFGALILGALFLGLVMLIALPFDAMAAYIAQDIWTMFVLPTFGLPVPQLWTLAGLILFIRFLKGVKYDDKEEKKKSSSDTPIFDAFKPFIYTFILVLVMWAQAHLFYWMGH